MATLQNISLGGGLTVQLGKPMLPDPYFNLTTFLLPGEGTNDGTNNTFLDSSSNAHTVTRVGTTTQGTVSPFSFTGWSVAPPAAGGSLSIPNDTSLDLSNLSFTIEFYVLIPKTFAAPQAILAKGYPTPNQFGPFLFFCNSSLNVINLFMSSNGLNYDIADGRTIISNPSLNTWYHIALTRDGNTFRTFVNGTQVDTFTSSSTLVSNSSALTICNGSSGYQFSGYISNLRIVKGTAVYTSNFTPPTSPLTNISGTSLLTCQSNRFVDNSSFNHTITNNGEIGIQPFSPFAPGQPYDSAIVGGSGYFDTNNELSFTTFSTTGAFTAECWFYRGADTSPYHTLFAGPTTASAAQNTQLNVQNDGSAYIVLNGTLRAQTPVDTVKRFAWNHIAFVRSASLDIAIFVNGVRANLGAASSAPCNISSIGGIGDLAGSTKGYISGLRITQTAVYDPLATTYTIPTLPPADISGTYILLNFTNGQINDATSRFAPITVNQTRLSNATSKWGTTSMVFEGTGDCLSLPASTLQNIGRGDFTLEFWIYCSLLDGAGRGLFNSNQFLFYANLAGGFYGNWYINYASPYSDIVNLPKPVFVLNTWQHIAVVRNNTTFTVYQQGNSIGSVTSSNIVYDATGNLLIGAESTNPFTSNGFVGYMNDIRFSLVARYTSNFTPPVEAFPLF